jgi:hypothetical protein
VPAEFGVYDGEVATPPITPTGPPTAVPAVVHPLEVVKGPHAKKLTVPVGVIPPAGLLLTVALSLFAPPSVIVEDVGVLLVLDGAWPAVKHSMLLPSEDPE